MSRVRLAIEHQNKNSEKLIEPKHSASSWSFSGQELPWVQGYSLARCVREGLDQPGLVATGSELLYQHLDADLNDPDVVDPLAWVSASGLVAYVGLNASGRAGPSCSAGR